VAPYVKLKRTWCDERGAQEASATAACGRQSQTACGRGSRRRPGHQQASAISADGQSGNGRAASAQQPQQSSHSTETTADQPVWGAIFSRARAQTEALKSTVSWDTHEMTVRSDCCDTSRTSWPHTKTAPAWTSSSRQSKRVLVDLPLPLGPTYDGNAHTYTPAARRCAWESSRRHVSGSAACPCGVGGSLGPWAWRCDAPARRIRQGAHAERGRRRRRRRRRNGRRRTRSARRACRVACCRAQVIARRDRARVKGRRRISGEKMDGARVATVGGRRRVLRPLAAVM
jgi:hypothetical protein